MDNTMKMTKTTATQNKRRPDAVDTVAAMTQQRRQAADKTKYDAEVEALNRRLGLGMPRRSGY